MLKFERPTLITLTAPTCSGKSYLLNALEERGLVDRIVSTTTRPMREGEREGVDYYFISQEHSQKLEADENFFELITFRGTRYGVTNLEMEGKMRAERPPIIVLEPQGLAIYEQKCRENGWDVFKVYVHVIESLRIQRLNARTEKDVMQLVNGASVPNGIHSRTFSQLALEKAAQQLPKIIAAHTDRLLSITGEERHWSNVTTFDAQVPGDNLEKAIETLTAGVEWRNKRVRQGLV